jgi:hypothetical protein
MTNPRNALRPLLRRLAAAGPARLRACQGIGASTLIVTALALTAFAPAAALAAVPSPSLRVAEVKATSATFDGALTPGELGATYDFNYGKGVACPSEKHAPEGMEGISDGEEALPGEPVTGLTPGTEYLVCLHVWNAAHHEETESFPAVRFTTAIEPETPTGLEANPIGTTTATLDGTLNPDKAGDPGTYEFFYQKSATECQGAGSVTTPAEHATEATPEPVKAELSALEPGTKYTFCLHESNEAGEEVTSAPVTFTTLPVVPKIVSVYTANGDGSSLELKAEINTGGAATTAHFEWGTSTEYSNSTPESASIGEDNGVHSTSAIITGLSPNTLYHFRVVAHNSAGTATGQDHTSIDGTHQPAPGECPQNEQFRTGYAAQLPDCRAYERVSPRGMEPQFESDILSPENITAGSTPAGEARGVWASLSGERLAFTSDEAPAGSPSDGIYFMSKRGPDGWSTEDLVPPQSSEYGLVCYNAYTVAFTPELSSSILADGFAQQHGTVTPCGADEPALVPGEPRGYQNLFVQDGESGSRRLADPSPMVGEADDAWFQGASDDLDHVVFDEEAQLTPEAPVGNELYMSTDGSVRLVSILPDGTTVQAPTEGFLANGYEPDQNAEFTNHTRKVAKKRFIPYNSPELFTHAVSADGSRVFWTTREPVEVEGPGGGIDGYQPKALYVRESAYEEQSKLIGEHCVEPAKACTVQVDAAEAGAEGPSGGGTFRWASADGSRVFFTDCSRLTKGSTAVSTEGCQHLVQPGGVDWETVPTGNDLYEYDVESGKLTDLTVDANASDLLGANVQGVSGVSEDGSHVYFVATGVLTGEAENSVGAKAVAGQPNLYLRHAGETTFIATPGDGLDWKQNELTARVSPNGEFFAFNSTKSLTTYENTDVNTGAADQEIFLYEAAQNKLVCVSCDPTGERPTAPAGIYESDHDWFGGPGVHEGPGYLQRNVLDDGRVFFDTAQSLLPQDSNGQYDVYEYEDGSPHLISSATSGEGSYFFEASPSGEDVFFLTAQQLPSGKAEATYSVYDARVEGGFPEPAPLTQCSEEDCKGAFSAAPSFGAPTSATFAGTGNPAPAPKPAVVVKKKVVKCKRDFVKKKIKKKETCVKKPKKKSKAKRASRSRRGNS